MPTTRPAPARGATAAESCAPGAASEVARPALSDQPAARLGTRRHAILQHLREAPRPLGVDEVAALTALHPNTARFHLDALTDAGLVSRTVEARTAPGRPRALFEPLAEAQDLRSYALLAEVLAGWADASADPRATAISTGRDWGRRLVGSGGAAEITNEHGPLDADAAVARLHAVFRDIGFHPDTRVDGPAATITLRHCPFRETAVRHPDVVCGLHLGMMQGALEEMGGAAVAESLEPFVEPGRCLARVRRAGAA